MRAMMGVTILGLLLFSSTAWATGAASGQALLARPSVRPSLSLGISALLLQSYQFNRVSTSFDATVERAVAPAWAWAIGGRLGLSPALPEGFIRLQATPALGRWMGVAGIEVGVTSRRRYDVPSGGVAEGLRQQAEDEISPFYLGFHTAALRFAFWERWRLSLLELQIGSHFGRIGEHVRVQLGLLSLGGVL
jgi:hypothetical protein